MERLLNTVIEAQRLCCLVGISALLGVAAPALAGQQEPASVIGQVTDASGGVLPGVTVTATSPSLQLQEMTAVTDARGEYRITPLPIGTYDVMYTLPGFQAVKREGIRLTVGFTAKIDVQLVIGSVAETITVSGSSPVVDVTSTGASSKLTRETMELIPTGRNGVISVLAQTPGVRTNLDVGGNTAGETPSIRAYGQTGESYLTLDGVLTSSSKNAQSGNFYDYSAFEETRVRAVTSEVDVPVRGVSVSAILKSGSNAFHGGGFLAQTNGSLQSDNYDDQLQAQGVTQPGNELLTRWDRSGELGGKLIENTLWFYFSLHGRRSEQTVPDVFREDGSVASAPDNQQWNTEKLSYQLNAKNHIDVFHQWQWKLNEDSGTSAFIPWESRYDLDAGVHVAGINWQSTPTSSLITSLGFGIWDFQNLYSALAPAGRVATQDIGTTFRAGAAQLGGVQAHEQRRHGSGTLTWYRPGLYLGNHEFKAGFDYWSSYVRRAQRSRTDFGNYVAVFNNGPAFQIRTQNSPVDPISSANYLAMYARDNWVIGRRLTLNLGARFSHDHGFVPEQCRPDAEPREFGPGVCQDRLDMKSWNSVAPRLYASFDVTGSGKTVVKGGWGRFDHMREIEEVAPFNSITPTITAWTWHDRNADRAYQPGEVNLDPNGPDFVSVSTPSLVGPFANGVLNPDEKQTKQDQFSVSLEHELMTNFAVRLTGMHARNFNVRRVLNISRPYSAYNIPITRPDPGADNRVGTSDDPGATLTYYDFPASLAGRQFEQRQWFNVPDAEQTFNTIELSADKRLSNRWQFMAAYSATKSNSPFEEEADFNPNEEINKANQTWEWLGKLSGTYLFPGAVTASARFEHRSGTPQARTVLFTGGQIGSIVVNAEPIGSIRLPNINTLDLRVEKGVRLPRGQRITVWLNIYNALNANTVTAWNVRSGTSYLRPTSYLSPRLAELSLQYRF